MTKSDALYHRPERVSGPNRSASDRSARMAFLLVLGSETVFFGMLIAAYLYLRIDQPGWPLTHAPFARLLIPAVNTVVLLASALTAFLGLKSIRRNRLAAFQNWLRATMTLGLAFIGGQVFEYLRAGMQPNDQAFGGVFFTLVGFHALHLVVGSVVLGLLLIRGRLGDFTSRKHIAVEIGTLFWFYVVAVWLVLFTALYLI